MNVRTQLLIALAVAFALVGDIALKRWSGTRAPLQLVACLVVWELCAISWVLVYRKPDVPLAQSTAFGAAIALLGNSTAGVALFGEQLSARTIAGVACAILGTLLLA